MRMQRLLGGVGAGAVPSADTCRIKAHVIGTYLKCNLAATCPTHAFPAFINSKDVTVKFAQALGDAVGSKVLEAAKGQGGYNERMMHSKCARGGQCMTPVRYMPDVPVVIDGLVKLVEWPWLPPSELLAAIMERDCTKVNPPADYWENMLLDFPGHPAGLLGPDVQACELTYNQSHHFNIDCSNTNIDSALYHDMQYLLRKAVGLCLHGDEGRASGNVPFSRCQRCVLQTHSSLLPNAAIPCVIVFQVM